MRFAPVLAKFLSFPGARAVWRRWPVGSIEMRSNFDVSTHAPYAYGVLSAARLGKALGLAGISVIEFGVSGGRGLLAMEAIAREVSAAIGIRIDVFGFDSGSGMPAAADYRDLPHVWAKGYYKMDVDALKRRLRSAELVIGDVAQTVPAWISGKERPPIGFIAFDLDYYSSTVEAFRIFDGAAETRLPRVFCYFDDVIWPPLACHNEFVGELLAIREFNDANANRKIAAMHLLRHTRLIPAAWNDQMYVMHDFTHPLYCVNTSPKRESYTQQPL